MIDVTSFFFKANKWKPILHSSVQCLIFSGPKQIEIELLGGYGEFDNSSAKLHQITRNLYSGI